MTDVWEYKYIVHSDKPKVATVKCTVPNCSRSWRLSGQKQGFQLVAAQKHCYSHWEKYHYDEAKHPKATWTDSCGTVREGHEFCKICEEISHKEYFNK
jgi:hypothetical protein